MTDEPLDSETAALAERLDAHRPRPSRGLRRRVRDVVAVGLRQATLRRRSVWLVASGSVVLTLAAVLALSAPT